MISRLPFTLPPRGSPARLPFLLLPVLALAAVVQLAVPGHVDLPTGGVPARLGKAALADPPAMVVAPHEIVARDPFAPISTKPAGPKPPPPPPPDPLGNAVISGVVEKGAQRMAVVLHADGSVGYLPVGGRLAGWRLDALMPGSVRLSRGRRVLTPAYGMHPSPPPAPKAPGNAADEQ